MSDLKLLVHQAQTASLGSKIGMVGVLFARTQVLQQIAQMPFPFGRRGAFHSLNESPVKQLERVFGKIIVNTVRMRRLIKIGPRTVSIAIGGNPFLNRQVRNPLARNTGKRMNSVVQQFEQKSPPTRICPALRPSARN